MAALRKSRITYDIKQAVESPSEGIFIDDGIEDIFNFNALISGPVDSPYETGLFTLVVTVPKDYPYSPVKITFLTKVFHPNIDIDGEICVDLLKDEWHPAMHLVDALEAVRGLLRNPNYASPLRIDASVMLRDNPQMFADTATTWTHHYANGSKTEAECERKIMILTAFKMTKENAIKKLTAAKWDEEAVLKGIDY